MELCCNGGVAVGRDDGRDEIAQTWKMSNASVVGVSKLLERLPTTGRHEYREIHQSCKKDFVAPKHVDRITKRNGLFSL